MTLLVIDRSHLHRPVLYLGSDGSSRFDLHAWSSGQRSRVNAYATARWRKGGLVTSSTDEITPASLTLWVQGSSPTDAQDGVDELDEALAQWDFTITKVLGSRRVVYRCCPATSFEQVEDDVLLEQCNAIEVSAVIPRQP